MLAAANCIVVSGALFGLVAMSGRSSAALLNGKSTSLLMPLLQVLLSSRMQGNLPRFMRCFPLVSRPLGASRFRPKRVCGHAGAGPPGRFLGVWRDPCTQTLGVASFHVWWFGILELQPCKRHSISAPRLSWCWNFPETSSMLLRNVAGLDQPDMFKTQYLTYRLRAPIVVDQAPML